jgi:CheY-like chemotaxis protein
MCPEVPFIFVSSAASEEAVGRLAAGIAHDFNNVLTLIQGYTQLLLTRGDLNDGTKQMLKEIFIAGDHAARLSRRLLTFSRSETAHRRVLNLNELLRGLVRMLGHIIGESVRLSCDCAAPSPGVLADAGLMEQLIMNLALNARDAMPRGGELRLGTDNLSFDASYAETHPETRAGEFVCLTVQDTGQGMAPEVLAHVFEPFFTTKEPGKGTGLGLATVYGIVRQHAGWVDVHTCVRVGTTFRVFLPLVPLPAARLSAAAPAEQEVRGGTETVLLVEDEPAVRTLAKQALERYGYRVREAISGAQALKVWQEHAGNIDVLLTDVVMPDGMTGRELAERLRAERPELRLILTSGYGREVTGLDTVFVQRETAHFLEKPYHPKALAQVIRRALDGN